MELKKERKMAFGNSSGSSRCTQELAAASSSHALQASAGRAGRPECLTASLFFFSFFLSRPSFFGWFGFG